MGSQLVDSLGDKRYDGVLGVWYGKAPGLDRAGDAIRHGVFAGHVAPRRRDGDRRRRPGGEVLDAAELQRRHPGRPAHADPVPRRRAGGARPGPPRRRPVARQRHLGRPQARHAGRRRHRHRRRAPRPRRSPSSRRWRSTASSSCPTRAAGCSRRTRSRWSASSSRSARCSPAATASPTSSTASPSPPTGTGSASPPAATRTTSCARRSGCSGCADDDALRGAGVRLFQLLMPVPVDEQQIRDFAHGLAEVRGRRGEEPDARAAREVGDVRLAPSGRASSAATTTPAPRSCRAPGCSTPTACSSRCAGASRAAARRRRPAAAAGAPARRRGSR